MSPEHKSKFSLEPSLANLLDQRSLRWIFVGGKGGVGKTTCSCALALQLARVRKSVLLISTDPAHNVSDAFNQKFSHIPKLVKGYTNLYAMELDTKLITENLPTKKLGDLDAMSSAKIALNNFVGSVPGIDEAMAFAEVIKLVQAIRFEVVVFDTAPTGKFIQCR